MVPRRQTWSLGEEFKDFAFKGNVVDLAVGVIIGAAFGKIVDALVKHIMMPLVSVLLPGQQSYLEWKTVMHGKEIPSGLFFGEGVNFLLIAVVIFLFIVKFLGWLMQTKHEEATTLPPLAVGPWRRSTRLRVPVRHPNLIEATVSMGVGRERGTPMLHTSGTNQSCLRIANSLGRFSCEVRKRVGLGTYVRLCAPVSNGTRSEQL